MKTFLSVMVFACISCFTLNGEEQAVKPSQMAPKKDLPAKAEQKFCAVEKDQTVKTPAKEAEKTVTPAKVMAAADVCECQKKNDAKAPKKEEAVKLAVVVDEKKADKKEEAVKFAALKEETPKKEEAVKFAALKEEPAKKEEEKVLPTKSVLAAAAVKATDEKTMKEDKTTKPVDQKLA